MWELSGKEEREGNLDGGWGGHGVRMGNVNGSLVRKSMHGGNGVANDVRRQRTRFGFLGRHKGDGRCLA